jgi:hypothetical protein
VASPVSETPRLCGRMELSKAYKAPSLSIWRSENLNLWLEKLDDSRR